MSAQRQGVVPSELHPLSIVRMFWKRKLVVALVWILGSAIAGLIVWKLPPVYKAEALILVDSQKIPDRYVTATVSVELQDRIAVFGGRHGAVRQPACQAPRLDGEGLFDAQLAGQDVAVENKSIGVGNALAGAGHGKFSVVTFREIAMNWHCITSTSG